MNAPIGVGGGNQGVHHLLQFDSITVHQQRVKEYEARTTRISRLFAQVSKSLSVRRVAGLRLLCLGKIEDLEKNPLQLLGTGKIHIFTNHIKGTLAGRINFESQLPRLGAQLVTINGNTCRFHLRQDPRYGKLHLCQQVQFTVIR